MLHIYICDDENHILSQLRDDIEKKLVIENYDMQIVCGTTGPHILLTALADDPQKRNIYFLDVELKNSEYDGFLLGKEIRRTDPHGTLVYITSYQDLAYRTFQYHLEAFDYIIKDPVKQKDSIDHCLESLYLRLQQEQQNDPEEIYSVRTGDTVRHIPVSSILYFETSSKAHHVVLHTADSMMDFVGNLNEIAARMGDTFIRTHRSYLVAADKITEIDLKHHKVTVGGHKCLISRSMRSGLLEKIKHK